MVEQNSIPIVDLSAFAMKSSVEFRLESAQALYKACHDLGFVHIQGHGVVSELLREAFDWSAKLYSLPHGEKMKAPHPDGPMPHRGFPPFDSYHSPSAKILRLFSFGAREGLL